MYIGQIAYLIGMRLRTGFIHESMSCSRSSRLRRDDSARSVEDRLIRVEAFANVRALIRYERAQQQQEESSLELRFFLGLGFPGVWGFRGMASRSPRGCDGCTTLAYPG